MKRWSLWLVLALASPVAADLERGKGSFQFEEARHNAGRPIKVWSYWPPTAGPEARVLIVMHGTLRNGETYRDQWIAQSEKHSVLLLVPEFPSAQFSTLAYHHGNVLDREGKVNDENAWTFSWIDPLFQRAKELTGNRSERYFLYGHSAGAQFVHRMVLFKPNAKYQTAVSANAGSYTMPDLADTFPFGLQETPGDEARLQVALGRRLLVLLGDQDTDSSDRNLPRGERAEAQGRFRLERGLGFFARSALAARELGVVLNWRLAVVPGVGHSNENMAPAAAELLFQPVPTIPR